MKPKYIKHYKDSLKVRRHRWRFIFFKHFLKNKGHLRRNLLRKHFQTLTMSESKSIAVTINRITTITTKEKLISVFDKYTQDMVTTYAE